MSTDPRTNNARQFALNAAGQVVGMNLPYEARPATKYRIARAALIDEVQALGEHVCRFSVQDAQMIPVTERVVLRWFDPDKGERRALPGNQDNKHVISSSFPSATAIGPLDILIEDAAGNIISDVWRGLGLPDKRHVCFEVAFVERTAGAEPEPEPGDDEPGADAAVLTRIAAALERLVAHFGA